MKKIKNLRKAHVMPSLPSDDEMEKIIDKELERLGYDCEGDKTADFTDGFIRGAEWMLNKIKRGNGA